MVQRHSAQATQLLEQLVLAGQESQSLPSLAGNNETFARLVQDPLRWFTATGSCKIPRPGSIEGCKLAGLVGWCRDIHHRLPSLWNGWCWQAQNSRVSEGWQGATTTVQASSRHAELVQCNRNLRNSVSGLSEGFKLTGL